MVKGIFITEKELEEIVFKLEHIDIELGSLFNKYNKEVPEQVKQINIYNDSLLIMFNQ